MAGTPYRVGSALTFSGRSVTLSEPDAAQVRPCDAEGEALLVARVFG